MNKILLLVAAAAIAGCANTAVKTKTELARGAQVTSRTGPVCLLAGSLPEDVQATRIGRIKATKGTYGETANLMQPIADEARRVGADAVVELQASTRLKSPLPWRVAAPTGDGFAVKFADGAPAFDCVAHGGQLL
jgi:hypothetical protein